MSVFTGPVQYAGGRFFSHESLCEDCGRVLPPAGHFSHAGKVPKSAPKPRFWRRVRHKKHFALASAQRNRPRQTRRLMSGQSVSRRLGGTRGSEREPFIEKSLAFFNKFIECSAGSGAPARPAAAAAGAAGPAPAAGRPPAAGGTGYGSGSASPEPRPGSRGG